MSGFVSEIPTGAVVVTDDNWQEVLFKASQHARGRQPRDWIRQPYGSVSGKFSLPLIPRSEWKDRIEEMERTKTRLSDMVKAAGIPPKNQGQTNYCWINGVITAIETMRCKLGLPYVELSPASVGAQIKGYRNVGGWGGEGLEWVIDKGVAPVSLWPANAINRQYKTPESDAKALEFRVLEWDEHENRNFDQKMTCLLNRIPVPSGYNHMSHEMCGMDPLYFGSNDYGCTDRNSWGSSQEWYVFHERLGTPDDAVSPRSLTPSG